MKARNNMLQDTSANNKRIAKNTFMLYLRMFVMMAVSLYTSRVVLEVLGETDYGIYNIIGGVVVLFSFLNSALLAATQRFLNYHIGREDEEATHAVFCMSMNSYLILSVIFVILAETIGLWFVNTQLNIPSERFVAVQWVYQFSISTFIVSLIRVPYNAVIIAYEKMDFFAYLSLGEVIMKLLVVYFLLISSLDKLVFFSFLYTITPLFITWLYKVYCNKNFFISKYNFYWDIPLFRSLFSFSGWTLFGSIANVLSTQGLNILVNIFYGVGVNAALGLSNQISTKLYQFVSNFQTAFNPQIVKHYANNDTESLNRLIFSTSKWSYYLYWVVALPLILEMDAILNIWLEVVPRYTAIFSKLIIVFMLTEALSAPLWMYIQATGNIKKYQIIVSIFICLNLPFAYLVLVLGMSVYWVWIVRIILNVIIIAFRCLYMNKKYSFPLRVYYKEVIQKLILVTFLTIPLPLICKYNISGYWTSLFVTLLVALTLSLLIIIFVGINSSEREFIFNIIRKRLHK